MTKFSSLTTPELLKFVNDFERANNSFNPANYMGWLVGRLMESPQTRVILYALVDRNEPFYAEDINQNGGVINGLQINRIIRKTGNTKEKVYEISSSFKLVSTLSEWELAMPIERIQSALDYAAARDEITLRQCQGKKIKYRGYNNGGWYVSR